jgi:transcriptional regulator of nitric oxide reductase
MILKRIYFSTGEKRENMLTKIETREIMTVWDAVMKYSKEYFAMVITEEVDQGDNDLGFVIYTSDDESEIYKIPSNMYEGKPVAINIGYSAEPYPQI